MAVPGKDSEGESFEPNHWGLVSVHGNVREWCEDCWNDNYHMDRCRGQVGMDRHKSWLACFSRWLLERQSATLPFGQPPQLTPGLPCSSTRLPFGPDLTP